MKIKILLVVTLVLLTTWSISASDELEVVNINALDLTLNKEQWEKEDRVQTQSEGINITIENHFTSIDRKSVV